MVLVHFMAPTVAGTMLELIGVFSVPVAYVSSLISILAMLTWVSMSKTYPGVNAPGGNRVHHRNYPTIGVFAGHSQDSTSI